MWTGHHVYITDQNHGYDDVDPPISQQTMPERPVVIGDGSWLGYGTVVLPGARIGRHVTVGANSVVTGELPDYSVAVGVPATVIRRYIDGQGWVRPTLVAPATGAQMSPPSSPGGTQWSIVVAGREVGDDVRDRPAVDHRLAVRRQIERPAAGRCRPGGRR